MASFWASPALDPKRQYRFLVNFGNIGTGVSMLAKTAKKPSFTVGNSKHQFLSHEFKFPTFVKWNDIQITIVDPAEPDMAKSLMAVLRTAGYIYPDQTNDANISSTSPVAKTVSKTKFVGPEGNGAIGNMEIQQLNADGTVIEKWRLKNAWISAVEFGNLSYASEDLSEITMTIVYDWAEIDSGVGGGYSGKNTKTPSQ